jgi:hypothetical protein
MLRDSADTRWVDLPKNEIAESCQVFFAVETPKHVLAGGLTKWAERGFRVMD